MPYTIRKRGNRFCVINKDTGKVKSCKFKSREEAKPYMKALYHAEGGGKFTRRKK